MLHRSSRRWALALVVATAWSLTPTARAQIRIVNVIPNTQSQETDQNSEPSLAVNPSALPGQAGQVVISAFSIAAGAPVIPPHPYYLTVNGGTTWTDAQNFNHSDTYVAWSPGGNAPGGRGVYETDLATDGATIKVSNSATQSVPPFPVIRDVAVVSNPPLPGFDLDQPRINIGQVVPGTDRVYIGYNNLNQYGGVGGTGATASVAIRNTGSAAGYVSVTVDQNPVMNQLMDSPGIPVASSGNTVYAAFERFHGNTVNVPNPPGAPIPVPNGDQLADVVLVRDDNGGLIPGSNATTGNPNPNAFQDLKTGVGGAITGKVIQNVTVPWTPVGGTSLDSQRLGANISVAADPSNPRHVDLAYTALDGAGNSRVHVVVSTDGGATYTKDVTFSPAGFNSGLPAIATAANGTLGLLYTTYTGTDLVTHFVRAFADLSSPVDVRLADFPSARPGIVSDPYIGDYQGLVAVGNTFSGTFSASNDPTPNNFPDPTSVIFQRNLLVGGVSMGGRDLKTLAGPATLADNAGNALPNTAANPMGISIDPYFFSVAAVPEPSALTMAATAVGLVGLTRIIRRRRSSRAATA